MADVKIDDLGKAARDAVYVTVGFGVLALQRLQAQRVDLQKRIDSQLSNQMVQGKEQVGKASSTVDGQLSALQARLTAVEERIEAMLDQVQATLPEQARGVMQQARDGAKTAREQVLARVRTQADAAA